VSNGSAIPSDRAATLSLSIRIMEQEEERR
jgi:hypothetical protein